MVARGSVAGASVANGAFLDGSVTDRAGSMPQSDLEKATAAKEATWRSWQELERVFQEVVRDPAFG